MSSGTMGEVFWGAAVHVYSCSCKQAYKPDYLPSCTRENLSLICQFLTHLEKIDISFTSMEKRHAKGTKSFTVQKIGNVDI